MIPVGDDKVQGGPPAVVNIALIILNVLAFFLELSRPQGAAASLARWGMCRRRRRSARRWRVMLRAIRGRLLLFALTSVP